MNKVKVTIRKNYSSFSFLIEIDKIWSNDEIESIQNFLTHEACVKAATEFCNNTFKSWEFV